MNQIDNKVVHFALKDDLVAHINDFYSSVN